MAENNFVHTSALDAMTAVEAVEYLFVNAIRYRASDIHIDPTRAETMIRLRIDGHLEQFARFPTRIHSEIVSRLKILGGARTDVHSVPQDGRFQSEISGALYNLRLSFMPAYHGENCVVRLLPASGDRNLSFAELGFAPDHVRLIERALSRDNGLVLVTGPTGSGKTTTLRACLSLKAIEPISVMTLEDPVEYEVDGVRHVHVREEFGVSFASGLRSALRQDPDVIMVGEIRDGETANTAINTALTGHLVLSTLHTNSAIETILRLSQMGVPHYLIAATLRLVVSQRLVRITCESCEDSGEYCEKCRGTGFLGRSVIAEVLEIDDELKEIMSRNEPLKVLYDHAVSRGFEPLSADAFEKIEWGVTSREEAFAALNS